MMVVIFLGGGVNYLFAMVNDNNTFEAGWSDISWDGVKNSIVLYCTCTIILVHSTIYIYHSLSVGLKGKKKANFCKLLFVRDC